MRQTNIFEVIHEQREEERTCPDCRSRMRESKDDWICDKCEIFKGGNEGEGS